MLQLECPVCAFPELPEPARTASGEPSYDYCPSCGFQFGVTDDDKGETYESWRQKWIANGMHWSIPGQQPPADWDPRAQLATLDAD